MTKIIFFRSDGVFFGFEEQNHTGYGEAGEDILCAALSAMTMLIVNTIELGFSSEVDYTVDEDMTRITVRSKSALAEYEDDEKKRFAVSGIFLSYYYQLNDMLEEYYDYIDVEVVDREYS